jgi:invasin B
MRDITSTFNPILNLPDRAQAFEKYAEAASQLARTADYRKLGQEALATALSVNHANQGPRADMPGKPQLQAPPPRADGSKPDTGVDMFTLLMAMLSELFGDVDGNKLKSRLAMVQNIAADKQQGLEKTSAEYIAAVESLATAEGQVGGSQEELLNLDERVRHFRGLLQASEARLAGLDAESPEYAAELARRDQLKGELASHAQTLQKTTEAHLQRVEIANAAARTVAAISVKVIDGAARSPAVKDAHDSALSSSAQALLNRLKLIELLGESAQNKEELNQELFLELQAKLQEHMQLESDKYLEEVRKAQALQETMGCIGKIIGGLVIAVSLAIGILTVNPALIAAGLIGGAMMLADGIVEATTGVSFMAVAMKPLMDLMQEAIKLFTDIFTELLLKLGVDPETAKEIAQVAGMIQGIAATLAAVVLVAVVGVQVIGPMVSALSSKLASLVAQVAPAAVQSLKQMASAVGNTLTQLLTQLRSVITRSADSVSMARYIANLEIAQAVTEFAGVAAQGGMQLASGVHQAKAAELLADVRVRMAISEEISQYLSRIVEDYGQAMRDRTRQIEQVFADLQRSQFVKLQMSSRI